MIDRLQRIQLEKVGVGNVKYQKNGDNPSYEK